MPGPLKNPKHERFAQAIVKGKTLVAAYEAAGYAPDEKNAARLTKNDGVAARIAELQERVAVRTEITVASITDRLLAIAAKGEGKEDAPMLSVARASLMDAAKLNGLVIDRTKHGFDFKDMTDEDIDALERIIGKSSHAG